MSSVSTNNIPGQRKLARYRHTQSCIRVAGMAPGREREVQLARCRVLAVITLLLLFAGLMSVLF
jgi:hypothetical protein